MLTNTARQMMRLSVVDNNSVKLTDSDDDDKTIKVIKIRPHHHLICIVLRG